jgi:hypothetical protein
MKVVISTGGRWKKLKLKIDDETFAHVEKIAKKYGFRVDDTIKMLLKGDFIDDIPPEITDGKIEELKREVDSLKKELYGLEGKWSPLKFKTYYLAMDNQNLAIQLAAMIAQNKRLRKSLGMEEKEYGELEEKIHYYLNFGSAEGGESKPGKGNVVPNGGRG